MTKRRKPLLDPGTIRSVSGADTRNVTGGFGDLEQVKASWKKMGPAVSAGQSLTQLANSGSVNPMAKVAATVTKKRRARR